MLAAFNASCLSLVPEQGTVGASGDLAPLSHLALGFVASHPELVWRPKHLQSIDSWEKALCGI